MARPVKNINPEQVQSLAGIGCTNEEIADALGCSADTLERRFAGDLEKGRLKAKRSLRRKQWELAQDGNVGMLIWLGKQMLGQSDKQQVKQELSGPDGGAIAVKHEGLDLKKLSDEQLKELDALVEAALPSVAPGD